MLIHYVKVYLLSPQFQNTSARSYFILRSIHHLKYGRQYQLSGLSPTINIQNKKRQGKKIPHEVPADAASSRLDQLSQFCLSTGFQYFPVKTEYSCISTGFNIISLTFALEIKSVK